MTRQNFIPSTLPKPDSNNTGNSSKVSDSMPALIPLWDLANHKDGEVTSAYNMELERLESLSLCDFKRGEQIFMYYGNRSNADLLVHNG